MAIKERKEEKKKKKAWSAREITSRTKEKSIDRMTSSTSQLFMIRGSPFPFLNPS